MATAEQELLLQGLMQFLDVPDTQAVESPVDDNQNGAQDKASTEESAVPAAPKVFTFRRGEYETGQLPVIEVPTLPAADAAPDEPAFVQKDGKKPVDTPEKSYMVSPDKLTSFADMMNESAAKAVPDAEFDWNALSTVQKAAYLVTGVLAAAAIVVILMWGINFVSGGNQYAAKPTVAATSSTLGAGGVVPTAGAAPTAAPAAAAPPIGSVTPAAAAGACEGIQFYHSPDVNDVGPCVEEDAAVVPTGVYGTDGVWIFMILPSGESKWAKAADYGYSAEQVKALNLKDYAAVAAPPPPTAKPATSGNGGWNPSGGPPPAATSTPEPPAATATAVPPTPTKDPCAGNENCKSVPERKPPPTRVPTNGTKNTTGEKHVPADPDDVNASIP